MDSLQTLIDKNDNLILAIIDKWNMRSFYKRCDDLIKDWLKNDFDKTSTYQNDPFLSEQKKPNRGLLKPEYIELMPEPFFGDPDNNLAVILNLNPGYGLNDKKSIGRSNIKVRLNQGYSAFAKINPYLTLNDFHPNAYKWWEKRYDWLKSLFGYNKDDGKPFTLEFCPWHSKNWSEAKINTINFIQKHPTYIHDSILMPAIYALKHSVSPCIISIGKPYINLYCSLGFKLRKEWGPNSNISNWPISTKTKKPKQVHFLYYTKVVNNVKIKVLSIWLWGSNKTPCNDFLTIEKNIIKYIRNH